MKLKKNDPDSVENDPFIGDPDTELLAQQISTFDVKPDLKPETKYGVFLWWSDRLPKWIHPDDIEIANRLVPGFKVFRREPCQNASDRQLGYFELCYGEESFRALPIVWLEITSEGWEVGDRVEVKSRHGKRRPGIATITDMVWDRLAKRIEYVLERNGMALPNRFQNEDLRPAFVLGQHLNERMRRKEFSESL